MGYTHINRAEFKRLKEQLDSGVGVSQLQLATRRSRSVLYAVKNSKSFADFKRFRDNKYHLKGLRGYKHMDEARFDQIKGLAAYGLKPGQIAELLNVSRATVYRVDSSRTWADYEAIKAQINAQRVAREAADELGVPEEKIEASMAAGQIREVEPQSPDGLTEILIANTQALADLAVAFNNFSDKLEEVIETKRPWMSKIKG